MGDVIELVESTVNGFYVCPLGNHVLPLESMSKHLLVAHFAEMRNYKLEGLYLVRTYQDPEPAPAPRPIQYKPPVQHFVQREAAQPAREDVEPVDELSPDRILAMVADPAAFKQLMDFLHMATMEERSVIFDDVSPITDELLSSPSGLQLLFAFLDLGRARHRASFLQTLEGNIERMLSSPNGCSILAHLISENPVTQDVPPSIIEELLTLDMHRLAVDRHASSVLFAVIESGSDEHRSALLVSLLETTLKIAATEVGPRLLRRIFASKSVSPSEKQFFISRLQGNLARLGAKSATASLVQDALNHAAPDELVRLLDELAYLPIERMPSIIYLLGDVNGYGVAVAETALRLASPASLAKFALVIAQHWPLIEGSADAIRYLSRSENAAFASRIAEYMYSDEVVKSGAAWRAADEASRDDDRGRVGTEIDEEAEQDEAEKPVQQKADNKQGGEQRKYASVQSFYPLRIEEDEELAEDELQRKYMNLDLEPRDSLAQLSAQDPHYWVVREQDLHDLLFDKMDELNVIDKTGYAEYLESLGLSGYDEQTIEWKPNDLCEAKHGSGAEARWFTARILKISKDRTRAIVQFPNKRDEACEVLLSDVRPAIKYDEIEEYRVSGDINVYERRKLMRNMPPSASHKQR